MTDDPRPVTYFTPPPSLHRYSECMRARALVWIGLGLIWLVSGPAAAQNEATPNSGFPTSAAGGGVVTYGTALVVDLDANGGPEEIVVGTNASRLFVFNSDGTVRAGWAGGKLLRSEVASSPAAGQLDLDGQLEIVVGSGSGSQLTGEVVAFEDNGAVKWRFDPLDHYPLDGQPDAVFSTPALGDLDGDGLDDVAFGAFDFRVWAVKGTNGTVIPGWPFFVRDSIWSSPALADLDGNGTLEVIIGSDVHAEAPPYNTPDGGGLWVFRRNGTFFPGFPKFLSYPPGDHAVGIQSSPVVGDVTGDGCPEIVVGTGPPWPDDLTVGRLLHVYRRDGTIPPGWPKPLIGHAVGSFALGNLDADAALEIVAPLNVYVNSGGLSVPVEGWLLAANGDGSTLFQMRPKTAYTGTSADALGAALVAQIGAQNPAVLVGYVGWDVAIVSKTGVQLSEDGPPYEAGKKVYTTLRQVTGPAVADLDDNGGLVIVGASGANASDTRVWAWNEGSIGSLPWPLHRQNPRRTGRAPGTVGCFVPPPPLSFHTRTPCRVSDSRLPGNLVFGGPKLVAGEERTITFHDNPFNACGVPATAKAVAINVTVTGATAGGFLKIFPGGDGAPSASVINFAAGQTRANNQVVSLSFDGRGNLAVNPVMAPGQQVHVILDVFGYFQ